MAAYLNCSAKERKAQKVRNQKRRKAQRRGLQRRDWETTARRFEGPPHGFDMKYLPPNTFPEAPNGDETDPAWNLKVRQISADVKKNHNPGFPFAEPQTTIRNPGLKGK